MFYVLVRSPKKHFYSDGYRGENYFLSRCNYLLSQYRYFLSHLELLFVTIKLLSVTG